MGPDIKVLKHEGNSLEVELVGEDHTLANLIVKYAIRMPNVTYASYTISHPLVSNPVVVISVAEGNDPLEVLHEVLKKIIADVEEFVSKFDEALKREGGCVEE